MKSTGEVLGIAKTLEEALHESFIGAGIDTAADKEDDLYSAIDADKDELVPIAARFQKLGYTICATRQGAADKLVENGHSCHQDQEDFCRLTKCAGSDPCR